MPAVKKFSLAIEKPWNAGNTYPSKKGWYERDHRMCDYPNLDERKISMDLWEPTNDPSDLFYPGLWFVVTEPYLFRNPFTGEQRWVDKPLNDASHQHLPWREA